MKSTAGAATSSSSIKGIVSSYSGYNGNYIYNPVSTGIAYFGSSSKPASYSSSLNYSLPASCSYSSTSSTTSSVSRTSSSISKSISSPSPVSRSSTVSYPLSQSSSISIPSYSVISRPSQSYTSKYISRQYIPPAALPKLGGTGMSKGLNLFGKQPKKYQVSLRAVFQGIKATSIPKYSFAGIGVRPMIIRRKRRKK